MHGELLDGGRGGALGAGLRGDGGQGEGIAACIPNSVCTIQPYPAPPDVAIPERALAGSLLQLPTTSP